MQESAVPILVVQEGQLAGKRWPLNRANSPSDAAKTVTSCCPIGR